MGYSVSRLTLYAVLSAIEEDLRNLTILHLSREKPPHEFFGEEIYNNVIARYEKDADLLSNQPTIEELMPYVDFADAFTLLNKNKTFLPKEISHYIRNVTPNLEQLSPIRNRVAHSRPLNYDDYPTTLDTAEALVRENNTIWSELYSTLKKLQHEPSFVLGLEIPDYFIERTNVSHNLPIPDFDETGFLGREKQYKEVRKACLGPYPVISIVAEGGVGKTALALKVAYEILDMQDCPFDAVVWTSSKTQQLNVQEIRVIEGAISDSLGMFQNVANTLGGKRIILLKKYSLI